MPLKKGKSQQIIAQNIGELIAAGYPPKQAAAISYSEARKSGLKDPGYPKRRTKPARTTRRKK